MTQWIDPARFERGELSVVDAAGVPVDYVETARETEDGVEVIAIATTADDAELVCSVDDGVTYEPVRARLEIPGGMILDLQED